MPKTPDHDTLRKTLFDAMASAMRPVGVSAHPFATQGNREIDLDELTKAILVIIAPPKSSRKGGPGRKRLYHTPEEVRAARNANSRKHYWANVEANRAYNREYDRNVRSVKRNKTQAMTAQTGTTTEQNDTKD